MNPSTNRFSVVLLGGGTGSRMNTDTPKQFLFLGEKPVICHSLDVLLAMPETIEVIVVCDPAYRHHLESYKEIKWALPGLRRQDSVYNGLQQVSQNADYVCIHDGCRPFINQDLVRRVFVRAQECGTAAAAMPVRFTVKEINAEGFVTDTPDRSFFWEIQTPQIILKNILEKGFRKSLAEGLTVTDDTSLAELVGLPVKLAEGAYTNLKLTTPDDLAVANILLKNR